MNADFFVRDVSIFGLRVKKIQEHDCTPVFVPEELCIHSVGRFLLAGDVTFSRRGGIATSKQKQGCRAWAFRHANQEPRWLSWG